MLLVFGRVWERWSVHTLLLWPFEANRYADVALGGPPCLRGMGNPVLVNCPFKSQLNPAVYLIQVQLELVAGLQVVGRGDPMDHVAPCPDHRLHRKEHVLRERKAVES